jgi:hypothetical protein
MTGKITIHIPGATPHFTRPELLTMPNVPPPMHGVAPRNILGRAWWKQTRQTAITVNNDCCWTCGRHSSMTQGKVKSLEAHECYDIDYPNGVMNFFGVAALCRFCHCFIHSGRSAMLVNTGLMQQATFKAIIDHGYEILAAVGLRPWRGTRAMVELGYKAEAEPPMAPWETWRLRIPNGREFPPLFPTEAEWVAHHASVDAALSPEAAHAVCPLCKRPADEGGPCSHGFHAPPKGDPHG